MTADLTVSIPEDIAVITKTVGEYEFTCQMGMYHSLLVIKAPSR